ncbi:MAG: RsmE family RNA methyltransferase [bacterium]
MPYFLHDGLLELKAPDTLTGEEAHHALHVRRVRPGERVEVQDSSGKRFLVQINELLRKEVSFTPVEALEPPVPSPLKLHLLLAHPREKALDWSLQKATELGVHEVHLFGGTRSPKSSGEGADRLNRWERICWEACKQCGRQTPPRLRWSEDLESALEATESTLTWVLEGTSPGGPTHEALRAATDVQLVIGPEGGFSPEERELLATHAIPGWSLGERILRTETAVVAATSILQFMAGDLGARLDFDCL